MSNALRFYYNPNCPYAQRSWITLLELGVAFEPVEIELGKDNKTDWFRAMNPNGTVPTIQHEGTVVYESLVVNEYLCEIFGSHLIPSTPNHRAQARILMARCDAKLVKLGYSYLSHKHTEDEAKDDQLRSQLEEELRFLDSAIAAFGGPYFLGKSLTLVDIAFIPFFQRMSVALNRFKNLDIRNLNLSHLNTWLEVLAHRDSCSQTQMSVAQIEAVYARFLNLDYFKKAGIAD
jgi:glutathione S-transferase